MPAFKAQKSFDGMAVEPGPAYPAVEIITSGSNHAITAHLATVQEIDIAVDALISDLNVVREAAKKLLSDYKNEANSNVGKA